MASASHPTPPRPAAPTRAPAQPGPQLFIKVGTHTGRVRDHNEDYFLTPELAQIPPAARQQRGELVIVADGMGGHAAGEVASRMTAEGVMKGYYGSQADTKTALQEAIQQVNAEIFHAQQRNAAQEGMGSTLTAAVFLPGKVWLASVGDSRIYRLRGGRVEQLTTDHTWVNEKLRSKEITPDEAATHPYRSVITRAMGAALSVQPDLREEELRVGDVYLLCSDGLSNMTTEDDLRQILGSEGPQPAITKLINLANSRGGPDNITAAVVSYGAGEGATMVGAAGKRRSRAIMFGAAGGAGALLLILFIFLSARQISNGKEPTVVAKATETPAVIAAATTIAPTVGSAEVVAPTSTLAPSTPPTVTPAPIAATPRPTTSTRPPVRATTPPPAQPLAAPAITKPDDGHTADQGFVRLVWDPVPGAAGYRVETRSDRQGQQEWREWPVGAALEMTLNFDANADYFKEPGTVYSWRVAALDGQGKPGGYSGVRTFEFNRSQEQQEPPATPTPEDEDTPAPTPGKTPTS